MTSIDAGNDSGSGTAVAQNRTLWRIEAVSNGGTYVVLLGMHDDHERARETAAQLWIAEFVSTERALHGIHANALMREAQRAVALERGHDSSFFTPSEESPDVRAELAARVHDVLRCAAGVILLPEGESVLHVVAA